MGPVRTFFALRVGTLMSMGHLRDAFDDPSGQAGVDLVLSRREAVNEVHRRLREAIRGKAELEKSLDTLPTNADGAIDPNQHPLLAWLVSPEGLATVWSIVSAILAIWGIVLPPLPKP